MSEVESKILDFLEETDFGASCTEISKKIDVSRPTVLKYLEIMRAKDMVNYREAGMTKLWHLHRPNLLEALEKEREEAEYKLRAILDVIGEGIAILDKDMRIVWMNKTLENFIGKIPGIKGRYCYEALCGRDEVCSDCPVEGTLETGEVKISRRKYKSSKGELRHFELVTSPVKDNDDEVVGAIDLMRDLTEREELEDALEEAERRHKNIFENINVGIYRNTPGESGKHVEVNPFFAEMFGYNSKEEILKVNPCDHYYNPQDKKKFDKKIKEDGYVEDEEFQYKRKDGTPFWVRETAVAVTDEKGKVEYYDGIMEDITEKKRLQEALKESKERYKNIVENINVAVYRSTPGKEGELIDVNPAIVEMLGYDSKEEFLKTKPSDHYQEPEERKGWSKEILKKGYLKNKEMQYKKKDGTPIWCLDTTVAVKDEDGKVKYYDGMIEDITEKKKLEEKLKKSEEKYRGMVENSPIGVYRTVPGKKGKWVEANPSLVKMLGYDSKEELLKTPVQEIYKNPKRREEAMQKVEEDGLLDEEVFEYKKKDGTTFWGRNTVRAAYDDKGNVMHYDGMIEDITEKKRLKEKLKESEKKYRGLVENALDVIYSLNEKGEFTSINSVAVELLGYSEKELLGSHFSKIIHEEDVERAKKSFKEQLKGKKDATKELELRFRSKDGKILYGELNSKAIRDEKGEFLGSEGVARDVTERKELEEKLKKSEKKYRGIFENATMGIYRTTPGPEGEYLEVNPALVRMLGYDSKEELMKNKVGDIYYDPGDREKFNEKMLEQGYVEDEELKQKKKDGTPIWMRTSARAIYDEEENVKYFDGVVEDITEKKELEKKLKKSERRYSDIFENINVGIYRATPGKEGKDVEVNPFCVKMFGYDSKDEIFKFKPIDHYVNPEDKKRFDKKMKEKGYVEDEIIQYKKKDGTPFWVKETAVAVRDENGKVKYYDGIMEDITEKIRLGEALKASERKYREIFGHIDVGVYRSTPGKKGRIIDANPAYVKMLGYDSKEELKQVKVCDLYQNPEERVKFDQKMKEQGYLKGEVLRLKKKDGTPLWVEETVVVVYDKEGKVKYYDGVVKNIMERWEGLESSQDALYVSTKEGKLLYMNQSGVELFGYENREEILDIVSVENLYFDPEERKRFQKEMERGDNFVKDFKVELKRKDGSKFTALMTSNARKDQKGKIIGYEGIIKEIK